MTEDDTFNRLRRIPFLQMFNIWAASPLTPTTEGYENIFITHGWTWNEYITEHHRYFDVDNNGH